MIRVRTIQNIIDSHKADGYKLNAADYGPHDLSVTRNGKEIAFYPAGQWSAVFNDTEVKPVKDNSNVASFRYFGKLTSPMANGEWPDTTD